jgi:hypothetical protein
VLLGGIFLKVRVWQPRLLKTKFSAFIITIISGKLIANPFSVKRTHRDDPGGLFEDIRLPNE